MNNLIKSIEDFSNLFGPSGFEDDVISYIDNKVDFLSKKRDSINNMFLGLNEIDETKPTIALDCHTDEVGFIVESINRNGTISFLPLGGWYQANLPASSVVIKNSKNEYIKGVIGSKPPHFMTADELTKLPKMSDMHIDIGTSSYKETKEVYGIDVGDPVAPDTTFSYDEKNKVMRGKAFDNRLGCVSVVNVLEGLKGMSLPFNVVGAMSAQEETGLRGATVSANRIKPDFAIIFEGSPADDTFRDEFSSHGAIGKGIQLRVIDGQCITNHRVLKYVKNIATKNNIPCQIIARDKGATNAAKYHLSNNGVPSIVLGVPARYIHSHYSYSSLNDVVSGISLANAMLLDLTKDIIESF